MNKNKKSTKAKGFGFSDAMFGIKDITSQYEGLYTEQNREMPPPMPPPPRRRPMADNTKTVKKVTVVNREPIQKGPAPMVARTQVKPVEKEMNKVETSVLIPMQAGESVFELTKNGKLSQWEYNVFCDGVEADKIVEDPQVSFDFSPLQVQQGGLGNCYFIASIASMAHLPMVLRQRIPDFKSYSKATTKSFKVNLFESGKNIDIVVDNLFSHIFVSPIRNNISLMILEKAYAQAYGNFSVLTMGHANDSMRDLTGAPTEYIDLKDINMLCFKIKEAFQQRFPLVIATKVKVEIKSLSPKHSYHILDFKIVGQNQIHIKIRDPRGRSCANFPNSLTDLSEEEAESGVFWVNYPMLVENFQVITSCMVRPKNNYYYKTFEASELIENQGSLVLTVEEPTLATISVHQKHKKFFDQKFTYGMIKLLVAEIKHDGHKMIPIRTIATGFKTQQVVAETVNLQPGKYVIVGQAGPAHRKPRLPTQAMTVSIYSSKKSIESLSFEVVRGKLDVAPFLKSYILDNKHQFKKTNSDHQLQRYAGPLYGFMCLFYMNGGNKEVLEELTYTTENITTGDKRVQLKPGEDRLLLHTIGEANNCSHKFSFKSKTLFKSG